MSFIKTEFPGLFVFEPKVFEDTRGYFFESYNQQKLNEAVSGLDFVQDNQSLSQKGVLRGLHFQHPPFAQGKLVRVIKGSVLDVALDIRKNSVTYGQYVCVELSERNFNMLYIPPGFAHGFLTLEDQTIFTYKCTDYYFPEHERTLLWNDSKLNINWKVSTPILSEKDRKGVTFEECDKYD